MEAAQVCFSYKYHSMSLLGWLVHYSCMTIVHWQAAAGDSLEVALSFRASLLQRGVYCAAGNAGRVHSLRVRRERVMCAFVVGLSLCNLRSWLAGLAPQLQHKQ
jgi:hypothetical protein